MDRLERERIAVIKRDYPEGTRVVLVKMEDAQAPMKGTEGSVMFVYDIGTVHIAWDSGSTLGAVIGEDVIRKVGESSGKECVNPFNI